MITLDSRKRKKKRCSTKRYYSCIYTYTLENPICRIHFGAGPLKPFKSVKGRRCGGIFLLAFSIIVFFFAFVIGFIYVYILQSVKAIIRRRIIIYIRFELTNKSRSLFIRSPDNGGGGGRETDRVGSHEITLSEISFFLSFPGFYPERLSYNKFSGNCALSKGGKKVRSRRRHSRLFIKNYFH